MSKIDYYLNDNGLICHDEEALDFYFECLFDVGIMTTQNKRDIITKALQGCTTKDCFDGIIEALKNNENPSFKDVYKKPSIGKFLNNYYGEEND